MNFVKRYTAPISIVVLIIVAGVTFATLRTNTINPPPILDPDLALWVESNGQGHPLIWQVQYVASSNDLVLLNQTEANGMSATELGIVKNDHTGWTYLYLSQSIDGPRLTTLFTTDIAIWVMKDMDLQKATLFGVEVNDGLHVLTFIFSDQTAETQQFLAHRTVYLQTPANTWVGQPLDFAKQYTAARWAAPPDHVTLSIVFGVGPNATAQETVYVHGFSVLQPKIVTNPVYSMELFARREVE